MRGDEEEPQIDAAFADHARFDGHAVPSRRNMRKDDVDVVGVREMTAGAKAKGGAAWNVIEQPAILDADARRGQIGQLQKRSRDDGDVRRCGDVHALGLRATFENSLPTLGSDDAGIGNQAPRSDHFKVRKLPFLLVLIGTKLAARAAGLRERRHEKREEKHEDNPRKHGIRKRTWRWRVPAEVWC